MRRATALLGALALLTTAAACKGEDKRRPRRTTTTSSSTTSTTSALTSSTTAPVFAPAPSGCDASQLRRGDVRADATRYVVHATYDPQANRIDGEVDAEFTPDRATDQVVVRLWPNGPDSAGLGGRIRINGSQLDGASLNFSLANPTTAVAPAQLAAGHTVTIHLAFQLTLPRDSTDRLSRIGDTVRLGSWLPLLPWEPGVGWALEPPTSSYAEASLSVHADFKVTFTVPAGLTMLATGTRNGDTWSAHGVADWAASIGVFTVVEGDAAGVHITVGVQRSMSDSPLAYLAEVKSSFDELSRRYGAYPYGSFTLALTPGMHGGIEYPGHVMQGPDTNARTTPHEVAHQWFYGLVGNNQGRDPWLDEGLATWAEAQVNGTYASFKSRSIPSDGRHHLGEPMTFWDNHRPSYYRSVYVQGLQALAALGVSPAAVDCALARYVAANAYRVATPKALADALATVAPDAASVLARYGAQRVS